MAYATIRLEKVVGSESFNSRTSHNNRKIITSNVKKEFTFKNILIQEAKYKNFDDFVSTKRSEIKNHNDKFGTKNRMIRKVLNKKTSQKEFKGMSQEFVISSSPNFLTEKESIEYLKKADKFLRDWFPDCEVLQSVIHLDEKTPHLHLHISYFDKNNKKFIQDKLIKADKTDINIIRNEFQKAVAKGFGLKKQDGTIVKNHNPKASLEIMELKKLLSEAQETILAQMKEIDGLKSNIVELEQRMTLLEAKNNGSLGMNDKIKAELDKTTKLVHSYNTALGQIGQAVGYKGSNTDDLISKIRTSFKKGETESEKEARYEKDIKEHIAKNGVYPNPWETLEYKEKKNNSNNSNIKNR